MFRLKFVMTFLFVFMIFAVDAGELGDVAKPLNIKELIKGDKIDVTDKKNVYIVEFWATWCPPCRTTIPELSKLQKKFKDKGVIVIGISTETAEDVKPFVKEQGDLMDYRVAIDNDGFTKKIYMNEFGVSGIPHAFIIDKNGKIAWHGHPMDGMEEVLEKVLAGKYSPEVAAADMAKKKEEQAKNKKLGALIKLLDFVVENLKDENELKELLKKRIIDLGGDNAELKKAVEAL